MTMPRLMRFGILQMAVEARFNPLGVRLHAHLARPVTSSESITGESAETEARSHDGRRDLDR